MNWGKSSFSESFPDIRQYFLGALFIGFVLLFPAGIVGSLQNAATRLRAWRDRRAGAGERHTNEAKAWI